MREIDITVITIQKILELCENIDQFNSFKPYLLAYLSIF